MYCLHTIPMHTYTHTCAHSAHAHTISMYMHQMCENTTTCARTVLPLTKQYSRTPDEDYPYLKIIFSSILKLFPPQFHGKDAAYPILQDLDNQSLAPFVPCFRKRSSRWDFKLTRILLSTDQPSYGYFVGKTL